MKMLSIAELLDTIYSKPMITRSFT